MRGPNWPCRSDLECRGIHVRIGTPTGFGTLRWWRLPSLFSQKKGGALGEPWGNEGVLGKRRRSREQVWLDPARAYRGLVAAHVPIS